MSTHILSDIEALCDNVAILRSGKLAATGNLRRTFDAKAAKRRNLKSIVKGVSAEDLKNEIEKIAGASIFGKAKRRKYSSFGRKRY